MSALPFSHPAVRDLAWALASPPLMRQLGSDSHWPEAAWFSALYRDFAAHLRQLDRDPRPLLDRLAGRTDQRLGIYFEALWRYWLDHNPRYRVLAANLAVRAGGRTLGEFDLIVRDTLSGKTLHWETALKFYLGTGDTACAENWWGPGRRDRLSIKTAHLTERQCRLSSRPEARERLAELGLSIDETWVILKGRLFYPAGQPRSAPRGSDPDHLQGDWLHAHHLESLRGRTWMLLDKMQWLAPLFNPEGPRLDAESFAEGWARLARPRPVCLAGIEAGEETVRRFIVPDDWDAPDP